MNAGAQLQQARKERKLSLADVTRDIKIQPWVLEALEADRLHEMMSPIYARGFLATYAKYLRLEPEPLLAQVRPPEPVAEAPQTDTPPTLPRRPVTFRFSLPRLPLPHLQLPRLRLPHPSRLGVAAAVSAVLIGILVGKPPTMPPAPALARVGPGGRAVVAKSKATPAPKLASVAPVATIEKPEPPPTVNLLPIHPLELQMSANRTTWVQVRADGKLLIQQRLQRGANERWVAKKKLELVIAKPSQVDLTLNGQSIGPLAIAHQGRLLITHYGVTKLPDEGE